MITEKAIYALGIGHNSPVLMDLAEACGYKVIGLYHYNDSRTGEIDHGVEIIGSFNDLFHHESLSGLNFVLTMGDNEIRTSLLNRIQALGGNVPSLIHPTAVISKFSKISQEAVYISPFVNIQPDVVIERNSTILTNVDISHSTYIHENCFIASGAIIGAYTTLEKDAFIGQGAISISGKVSTIGSAAMVGAGALITHDVPAHAVCVGVPAKVIRYNK